MKTYLQLLAKKYAYDPLIQYLMEDYCRLSHSHQKLSGAKDRMECQNYRIQVDLTRALQQIDRCTSLMEHDNRRIMSLQRKIHVLRSIIARYEQDFNRRQTRRVIPERLLDTIAEAEQDMSLVTDSEVSDSEPESEDLLNPLI